MKNPHNPTSAHRDLSSYSIVSGHLGHVGPIETKGFIVY